MAKILLVEDDATLLETLEYNLQKAGYTVTKAGDGLAALQVARRENPDLVILDLMLPLLDGLSVCRLLRQESQVPILMLTARAGEIDKIVGLEAGADDYLTKPFSLGEFLARVRALLRRTPGESETQILKAGNLSIDLAKHRVWHGDRELILRPKEFELLVELAHHRGMVLTREALLERVWGYDYAGETRTVDVHIRRLRKKIERDPSQPQLIQTVRGVGYRLEG